MPEGYAIILLKVPVKHNPCNANTPLPLPGVYWNLLYYVMVST